MKNLKRILSKATLALTILAGSVSSFAVTSKANEETKIVGLSADVKEVKGAEWDLFAGIKSGFITLFKNVKWVITILAIGMFILSVVNAIARTEPDYGSVFKNMIGMIIILGVVWGIEVIVNLSGTTVDATMIEQLPAII